MLGWKAKFCCVFVFVVVLANFAFAGTAVASERTTAKFRGDGALVGDDGLIVAIPNPNDPRNSEAERYYFSVDAEGNVSDESVFRAFQNPDSSIPDFVKEKLPDEDEQNKNLFVPNKTGVYEFN